MANYINKNIKGEGVGDGEGEGVGVSESEGEREAEGEIMLHLYVAMYTSPLRPAPSACPTHRAGPFLQEDAACSLYSCCKKIPMLQAASRPGRSRGRPGRSQ